MMLRYTILILFTVFIFGPIFGLIMILGNLGFGSSSGEMSLVLSSAFAFLGLLLSCAAAAEKQPKLVKGTLQLAGLVFLLFLLPALCLPAIT